MAGAPARICHYSEVPLQLIGGEAAGASVRWLIDGAPVYALRMVELAPFGHTLHHNHAFEHEVFVLEGRGKLFVGGVWHQLRPGDVVYVPAGTVHEFANAEESTFKFLCGDPIRTTASQG